MHIVIALLCLVAYPDSARLAGLAYNSAQVLGANVSSARVTVRDKSGRLHLVYPKNGGFVEDSCEVYETHSSDNGLTWSPVYNISRDGNALSTLPSLAMDSTGALHCTWFQFWDTVSGKYDFFYAKTLGDTWSTPVNISRMATNSNYAEYSCICADPRGVIHVAFEYPTGGPDIYYTRPSGDSWLTPVPVSTSPLDDGFPSIASDSRSRLHLCWRLRGADSGYVMYSRYDTAWLPPQRVAAFPIAVNCASLAVGPDDVVHIVCAGNVLSGNNDIFHMQTSGDTWTHPENISNTAQFQSFGPQVAVENDSTLCVVWTEATRQTFWRAMCRYRVNGVWQQPIDLSDDTVNTVFNVCIGSQVQDGRADVFWAGTPARRASEFLDTTCIYMLHTLFPSSGVMEPPQKPGRPGSLSAAPTLAAGTIHVSGVPVGASVRVCDASARCVRDLGRVLSGKVEWRIDDDLARHVQTGIYFVCIVKGQFRQVKKMVVINSRKGN